jgi:hypothetical protein
LGQDQQNKKRYYSGKVKITTKHNRAKLQIARPLVGEYWAIIDKPEVDALKKLLPFHAHMHSLK